MVYLDNSKSYAIILHHHHHHHHRRHHRHHHHHQRRECHRGLQLGLSPLELGPCLNDKPLKL
eukprot:1422090-Amphidinium_carterae.1